MSLILDVFKGDAFTLQSLTDAILKAPYKPGRLGELKLFRERGIPTTSVTVEEKDGRLSLIQSSKRGGPGSSIGQQKRKARTFGIAHLERESEILADEVQGVRAFGSGVDAAAATMVAVQQVVDERLQDLRKMHEVTLERQRVSAIQGQVLDADGSVLIDLLTEFGVSQTTHSISVSADDIRNECTKIQRKIEYALGADSVGIEFRALCGDTFFDDFIACNAIRTSLQYQESALLRTNVRKGFEYGGIVWENYRGRTPATQGDPEAEASNTPFIADDEAYVVPVGSDIFRTYFGPADFVETVNTIGLPIYAKQALDEQFQRWVKIHTQSNPLVLCLRPKAVVKVTLAS